MKKILKTKLIIAVMVVFVLNLSCTSDDGVNTTPLPETDLIDVANSEADLSTLIVALERANLTSTLQGNTRYTVLAPSNSAFNAFLVMNGYGSVDDVPVETLEQLLLNHVITGLIDEANLTILQKNYLETLAAGPETDTNLAIYFDASDGITFNGSSRVTEGDVLASNGVIHIVDTVVDFPTIETFTSTDENFEDLDTAFDLISPVSDLPQTIKEKDSGPFTVFAPINDAFDDLLASNSQWEFLSDIDEGLLTAVLEHHLVNGNDDLLQLAAETTFTTLEGDEIVLNSVNGRTEITDGSGNAGVLVAEGIIGIQAINGIIHILPTQVMIPNTTN